MAKRKRRPGGGVKLQPIKDYREEAYTPYIMNVETGILQAWTLDADIRDGDVREALRGLMSPLKRSGELPKALTRQDDEASESKPETEGFRGDPLIQQLILMNLRSAFKEHGPLDAEELVGILTVVNNSVGAWNRGMRGQEYLKYIKGFLGGAGIQMWQLSDEEVENLELYPYEQEEQGEDDEIK